MATQADLDAALTTVETAVTKLGTDLSSAIKDLEAKIAAGSPTVNLSAEVTRLQAVATSLGTFDASATAADPGPQTPPTTTTPPVAS